MLEGYTVEQLVLIVCLGIILAVAIIAGIRTTIMRDR